MDNEEVATADKINVTQFGQHTPTPLPVRLTSSTRASLLTYEIYYGLREKPFSLSPDPKFLYKSKTHAPTYDSLLAGIRRREGLIVLTGDIGTGKTTLCRAVIAHLDQKTFSTFVPDPFLSREDLLKMMLLEFGAVSYDDLKLGRLNGVSRLDLSYRLYEFLRSLVPLQAFAVLIIDEAQNLSVPLLEEIRILSDLEAPEKLLQVVLVGQLELREKLKLAEMRQVDQRVSVRCELEALTPQAVAGYIAHRLDVVGGASDRVAFSVDAMDLVERLSGGVPRVINLICDRALYRGYLSHKAVIDPEHVRVAMADLGLEQPRAAESVNLSPAETTTARPIPGTPSAVPKKIASEPGVLVLTAPADRPLAASPRPWNASLLDPAPAPISRRPRRVIAMMAVVVAVVAAATGVFYAIDQFANQPMPQLPPLPAPPPKTPRKIPLELILSDSVPFVGNKQTTAATIPAGKTPAASEGIYAIDVALFNSTSKAGTAVAQLAAAGFRAFLTEVDLGPRGIVHEVLVGLYDTRDAAEVDLARIREMPDYRDARITTSH